MLAGAETLVAQVNQMLLDTSVPGREIRERAVTAAILIDKVRKIEESGDEHDGANPEQLEAEIARLQRELKKR